MKNVKNLSGFGFFVKKILRQPFFNDEPKIYRYVSQLNLINLDTDGDVPEEYSVGTSIDDRKAALKSLFEAMERFNLAKFRFKDFIFESYQEISKSKQAINPTEFCHFSKRQLANKKYQNFYYSPTNKFYWTRSKNLATDKTFYLPAQVIFCPYKYQNNESVLAFPITTGSSTAPRKEEAIYRGINEVIERDAYMTNYLFKLNPEKIIYNNIHSKQILKLLQISKKYNLEVKSFILISDWKIPTILSVLIDKTGNGPALSVGLKTEWNLEKAIVGSIEEAYQIRSWIRICMIKNDWKGNSYTGTNMLKRAYLWKSESGIKRLGFFLESAHKIIVSDKELGKYSRKTSKEKLEMLKGIFNKNNIAVYYKDVTSPKIKISDAVVVKCIIPKLHPMYIDQDFPYLGGPRIISLMKKYNTKTLNLYPHPFL